MRRNAGSTALAYDPTNPEAHAEEEAQASLAEQTQVERDVADFLAIMRTAGGRRFFRRMLDRTHVFETSFTGNSQTFMLEGERAVGLWLWSQIQAHAMPEYLTLLKEQDA